MRDKLPGEGPHGGYGVDGDDAQSLLWFAGEAPDVGDLTINRMGGKDGPFLDALAALEGLHAQVQNRKFPPAA